MEPLAIQASASLRPIPDPSSELSAVLREGRVLAGEVLQTLDGGTLLIGIGSHRVPAESHVEMQPGQRFLFRVEAGDPLVLRVLASPPAVEEPALVRALRGALASVRPIGHLLAELAGALAAEPAQGALGAPAAAGLRAALQAHLFRPALGGEGLRELLETSGLFHEGRLARLAPHPEVASPGLAPALREALLADLSAAVGSGSGPAVTAGIAGALRQALLEVLAGGEGTRDAEALLTRWLGADGQASAIPRDLARLLGLALSRLPQAAQHLAALERRMGPALEKLSAPEQERLLRLLLELPERDPARAAGRAARQLELIARDLKGELLGALGAFDDGPVRQAVARALAGVEADQLLELARRESREPLHWSLPLFDGERFATAHVLVRRLDDGGRQKTAGGDEIDVHRVTLALELSGTGAVRADVIARPGAVAVRVLASRPSTLALLASMAHELEARLALGGRRVSLSVQRAAPEELRVEQDAMDVRFLRDHHLMDLSG